MVDKNKEKAATPLVDAYEQDQPETTPTPIDTAAPVSTDKDGERVDLPDQGGKID